MEIDVAGVYNYRRIDGIELSKKKSIVLSAKLSNDLHVGLLEQKDIYDKNKMYEIVIGGWANTRSVIR